MTFLKWISWLLLFAALTIVTQVGGVILLLCYPIFQYLRRTYEIKNIHRLFINVFVYCAMYAPVCQWIVPPLARHFGRVPLPTGSKNLVRPHSQWYVVLNRHYVVPVLAEATQKVAIQVNQTAEKTIFSYLDAGFPFAGMPLLPHLSHGDGKQLDFTFCYLDANKQPSVLKPSRSGYGIFELPQVGEPQTNDFCKKKFKNKFYDFAQNITFGSRKGLTFDPQRTKLMIHTFAQNHAVRKIFLEPHLTKRLNFNKLDNIRPAGCNATRHDDHFHVQVY